MKKAFLYLLGIVLMATSCLDIADVYQRLDTLEQKVAGLEGLNTTVSGLSNSIEALRNNVYVKEVTETDEGYVIKFTDNTQAVIRDGVDGEDGQTPTIGVKEEGGELVWTVNGKVVKDESGKAVPATVKVPEFQFDNNKWWYRFGPTDSWKDCGEKTGPEPSIEEDEQYVYINIGDNSIAIPKEVISPAIEEITVSLKPRKNLFIPVGETVDLKDFFEVEPEGALKTSVNFEYAEGAFTIDKKGIVTVTGNTVAVNEANHVAVKIVSKANPEINATINIRACAAPNNEEIECTCTVPEAERIYMFKEGLEDFNALASLGGAGAFNPVNQCLGGLMGAGGMANMYFTTQPFGGISIEHGHLHFEYYVSSLEKLNIDAGQVELCSGGADNQERNWPTSFLKNAKVGWNEVDLALKDSGVTGDPFNTEGIKWFRMYVPTSAVHEEAIMVKNVFVYEEAGPVQITIDGDMSDWARVKGSVNESDGATYLEFKMASDANNIYFYTKRVANSALWNAGGYLYYALDYDNNPATGTGDIWGNSPYECIFVIWPFAGTGDAPAFAEKPLGESMMKPSGSLANYNANGKADASGVELEFSIPRADFPTIPDSEITVYAWGNKSGENMKNFPLKIKL